MGIDFLDCVFRLEREFGLSRHDLTLTQLDAFRTSRGVIYEATAEDVRHWVEVTLAAKGREAPPDLWPRVQAVIAATVSMTPDEVARDSRLIEDLGFT